MYRRLIALAILGVCQVCAMASDFKWGPQLGANFTDVKFNQQLVTSSMQPGPSADVACEFIFTNFGLGIDFGLGYSMTGAKINLGERPIWSLDGFSRETTLMHNLRIPVHLRWKWTKMQGLEEIIAPIVYGGPEFNIQLGHSRNRRGDISAYRFSGGDFCLACGAGIELMRHWQITAGYTWGMTYALKTRLLEDFTARCSGWNVRVAYMF